MNAIAILTATYNHPDNLLGLFSSLQAQTDRDFTWVIVNDGSGKETEEALLKIQSSGGVDTVVINKVNGGKSSAVNHGLDSIGSSAEFILIIDDDEQLFPDAVARVREYVEKYRGTECGVIHFNRQNERGELIASPDIIRDGYMSYQQFKSKGLFADGYLGYFTEQLRGERFILFPKEKYIAPSTLFMKVTGHCKLLWASAALGKTEYLAGGITRQGRRLRIRNPKGMLEYCRLMQQNGASLKTRVVYSVHGFAYLQFCAQKDEADTSAFLRFTKLPGKLLAKVWKAKYKDL